MWRPAAHFGDLCHLDFVRLGQQLEPGAVQHLPDTLHIPMTSGLLPAAAIAIDLNLILPEELTEEFSGGMVGQGKSSLPDK